MEKSYAPRQQSTIHLWWLYHFDLIKMMMEVFIHAHVHLVLIYLTACVLSVYLNLSYCLYACNNFLHVNSMSLINKHTKEDFFYLPSTATYTTHPRHKLAQSSKFHLLFSYLLKFPEINTCSNSSTPMLVALKAFLCMFTFYL